jgi:phage terminase large subunit GpA-like protein
MIPIVRACYDPAYRQVVAVLASQTGKTDNLLNVIGHRVDDDPVPILYLGPTRNNVERVIEPRLTALFRSASSLWEKLAKGKKSTKTHKNIGGVSIRLGWSGSTTELAAQPAGLVLVDERDRMESNVSGEGDPVTLAAARHSTYSDGRTVVTSSPTIGNVDEEKSDTGLSHWQTSDADDIESPIWKLWQEGTRYEWAWPCPECHEYFIPRFSCLWWPEGSTAHQAGLQAKLICPRCGSLIDDASKTWMNAHGVYVAPGQHVDTNGDVQGDIEPNDTASYWVSGLCSPWRSFGQLARTWLKAVESGDPERIQATLNTGFGELYKTGGNAPPWEQVTELRQAYKIGDIPQGVIALTCGVDVQKDRLIYALRGWGVRLESWLIEANELWGETEFSYVWNDLAKLINARWGEHHIKLMLIDSGYRPGDRHTTPVNQVYAFCRQYSHVARATKGQDVQDKPLKPTNIDVAYGGKTIKNGLQLWNLDTDYFKSWVHTKLDWPAGEPGGWHLPEDVSDDYCQQIVAESRVVKPSGKAIWVRLKKANHYLDCEMQNVAAAYMLQLHRMTQQTTQQPRRGRKVRNRGI